MIFTQKTEKFRIFGYLIVTGFFFLTIQLTYYCITESQKPDHLYSGFKTGFANLEDDLNKSASQISQRIISKSDTVQFLQLNQFSKQETVPGISLFVFHRDTLKWWNSNHEVFPHEFSNSLTKEFQVLKLENGWYAFRIIKKGSWTFVAGALIKNEYSFRNDYLQNDYSRRFNLTESVQLSEIKTVRQIYSKGGDYLFSISFVPASEGNLWMNHVNKPWKNAVEIWFLVLFLGGAYYLSFFLDTVYAQFKTQLKNQWLITFLLITNILIFRFIQFYLQFPAPLYQTELFSPAWYSSSFFLPSPGDFLVNVLLILALAFKIRKVFPQARGRHFRLGWRILFYQFLMIVLFAIFLFSEYLIGNLTINSSFPLNFQNIAELIPASFYGLLIVTILLSALMVISNVLISLLRGVSGKIKWLIPGLIICIVCYGILCQILDNYPNYLLILLFSAYIGFFWKATSGTNSFYSGRNILFMVFFFSLFVTLTLNKANSIKESGKINLLALQLASKHNPVTEDRYQSIAKLIKGDTILTKMVISAVNNNFVTDSLDSYLKGTYFNDYWRRYNIQITICTTGHELRVQPQGYLIDCELFFNNQISNYGEPTGIPGFHYLDYGYGKEFYLARFNFLGSQETTDSILTVYLEFSLNGMLPDPGYPGLLLDQTRDEPRGLANYSYAIYQQKSLVQAVGDVNYPLDLGNYRNYSTKSITFTENDFDHYYFRVDKDSELLISKKHYGILAILTPFSYFFTLFALIWLIIVGFNLVTKGLRSRVIDLRIKLQLSLTGILIFTMVIIGMVQIIYIININQKKNQDYLREKAYSIKSEVQHKYGSINSVAELMDKEPENFLIKLSNVFFTDINFYDPKGFLIASSRDKIFREGLISDRINPVAYQKMIFEHSSWLIHDEEIGTMKFASGYLPMYNDQGTLLGYINLPYFARQDELKREISSFLVTFINIYIVLILFGVMISILISNYITSPLTLLASKMSRLRLGKSNEKIDWENSDEIGKLVAEYNRMIEELERSAIQLAKTEREGAWREMARQVAHEIKNPLTPMKLSAQYLQRAWKDQATDMDLRIERFTKTLVEQIDTLAAIASDFSDFARMPQSVPERINLVEIINAVLTWYPETSSIQYLFHQESGNYEILADRSQMTRVLSNLINNSVQAIGSKTGGTINIRLKCGTHCMILEVSDNGSGIPADKAAKIFQPDFTTKSGGMGLGLAIVKGIILEMKGEISFQSNESSGTTFIIKLPFSHQQQNNNEQQ